MLGSYLHPIDFSGGSLRGRPAALYLSGLCHVVRFDMADAFGAPQPV